MEEKVIDITGVELTPGNPDECLGNGEHLDNVGVLIECCCDECDYLMACMEKWDENKNS